MPSRLKSNFSRHPILSGTLAAFVLLAAAYTFSIDLRASRGASITGDEPFYLLTTQSLIEDGDLDLRQQFERESYRSFFDHPDGLWQQSIPLATDEILSPHEPGLSFLVLPAFWLGGLRGAQVELLLIAAATFALTYVLVAGETGRHLWSWLVTMTVGLSATAFVYATEVYPEIPAALCIVLSLLVLRRPRQRVVEGLWLVVLLSLMAWLGQKYLFLGCVLVPFYLVRADRSGRSWFIGLCAVSGVAYIWYHLAVFGHLTAYSVNSVYRGASTADVLGHHLSFSPLERAYRLYGLFIDRRFGIGRWAPLLLLVLPSLPLMFRHGHTRLAVAGLILVQLGVATFVAITMMGYWFPGRTLMTVLPLFSLVIVTLLTRSSGALRRATVGLGALTLLITAGLTWATRRGDVTLAVDPFLMTPPGFQELGAIFPNYQSWTPETTVLTLLWLTVFGVGAATVAAVTAREAPTTRASLAT